MAPGSLRRGLVKFSKNKCTRRVFRPGLNLFQRALYPHNTQELSPSFARRRGFLPQAQAIAAFPLSKERWLGDRNWPETWGMTDERKRPYVVPFERDTSPGLHPGPGSTLSFRSLVTPVPRTRLRVRLRPGCAFGPALGPRTGVIVTCPPELRRHAGQRIRASSPRHRRHGMRTARTSPNCPSYHRRLHGTKRQRVQPNHLPPTSNRNPGRTSLGTTATHSREWHKDRHEMASNPKTSLTPHSFGFGRIANTHPITPTPIAT